MRTRKDAIRNAATRFGKATRGPVAMVHKIVFDRVIGDIELWQIWLALQPLYFEIFDTRKRLWRG